MNNHQIVQRAHNKAYRQRKDKVLGRTKPKPPRRQHVREIVLPRTHLDIAPVPKPVFEMSGTETGRISCETPNEANIGTTPDPSDNPWNQENPS